MIGDNMHRLPGSDHSNSGFRLSSLLIVFILLLSAGLSAQVGYSYTQIMKMMFDSPITYTMGIWDTVKVIPPGRPQRYDPIFYQEVKGKEITVRDYVMDERTQTFYDKAEELFNEGEYELALGFYATIHEEHPELSLVTTYMGQTLRILGEYDSAKSCFIQAIKSNFHNYMAHWFLANIYFAEGKTKQAVHHITLAKILCRNNPTIDETFERILREADRNSDDHYFEPQVRIYKAVDNEINIEAAHVDWLPYAHVKAMWMYEPGFHNDVERIPDAFNLWEAGELYVAMASVYEKRKSEERKIPILNLLYQSYKKKLGRPFVLYEMMLPETPVAAVMLPKQDIMDIQKYLLKVKHKKL